MEFAVVEANTDIVYAATASGGAWKTVNGGTSWKPVFDRERTVSIGAIAVSQANPNVVWIGTGEDVANLVAWLASDEAEHLNGATLRIDGAAGAVFRA